MVNILALDTSAAQCAVAVSVDGQMRSRIEPMATGQAERLLPLCEEILAEVRLGWKDLDAIGVGIGPGNFTGTRIGVAAARGLALALDIPAVGVTVFEALALGQDCTIVQDARRGMVYAQGFSGGEAVAPPVMVAVADTLPITPGTTMIGSAAEILAPRHTARTGAPLHPLPEAVALIARGRFADTPPRPAPLYLRPADAAPPRMGPPPILPG